MAVKDLIAELQRKLETNPELGAAEVYICRDSESRKLYSDDISWTEQVCDADEGEHLDGIFLELLTWS